MEKIKAKLESLCVLRGLLLSPVISLLLSVLENPTNSAYAEFVAALYDANGGNLSKHIKEICDSSENVYIRTIGEGREAPKFMYEALCEELKVMQKIADLTPKELKAIVQYDGFLPDFANSTTNLLDDYLYRQDNISKCGYGIYAKNEMFYVDGEGTITPVSYPDKIRLSDLVDYKRERSIIVDNTKALLNGKPAANILLTGDAGTGKSSTVKAIGNELFSEGLRIIEVRKDQLRKIPIIMNELSRNSLKFILFIDDLSFLGDDDSFNTLKAALEGSVSAKSKNVVIYATSNHRHIIKEKFSDRAGDDVHRNDTVQELISLSERFGIHVSFSKPNKETFLHIVRHLAKEENIYTPITELEAGAERMALERGGRSARLARQYIDGLLSK